MAPLGLLEVGVDQLGLDDLDVAQRVHFALGVDDPGVAVRAHAEAALSASGDLHDPDGVSAAYLTAVQLLQL
jgi:hypothetical protein